MKLLRTVVVVFVIILIVIFAGASIFVRTHGRALLSDKLGQFIGEKVDVGSLSIRLPCSVSIKNFTVENLLSIDRIQLEPSIIGLFAGKVGLNKLFLIGPEVSIVRSKDETFNFDKVIDTIQENLPKGGKKIDFFIKEALIKDGTVSLKDMVTGSSFKITPVEVKVVTTLPDLKTHFNLDAKAVSAEGEPLGEISSQGWLNFLKKDMEATVSLKEVALAYFSSLFNNFEKRVESGTLFFNADALSKNNDLTINCHMEARNLQFGNQDFAVNAGGRKASLKFPGPALNALAGLVRGGSFDFSIHTKFDQPRLEGLQFRGDTFEKVVTNILNAPSEERKEAIKKVGESFKDIGKQFEKQFKDMKEQFKAPEEGAEPEPQEGAAPEQPVQVSPSEPAPQQEGEQKSGQDTQGIGGQLESLGKDLEEQFKGIFKSSESQTTEGQLN